MREAHENASKGKKHYKEVKLLEESLEENLIALSYLIRSGKFNTGEYTVKERVEGGKLRTIHTLPYFPDRVVQHAILQKVGGRFYKSFIRDTFQSIKGRGTSDARKRVYSYIRNNQPKYYLQMDIKKFYPSIDNQLMKDKICKLIKCEETLNLLFNIVDSCKGLPIGNYTSQVLGNYYLTELDWYVKQDLGVGGYFRYCDDLIIFGDTSKELHDIRVKIDSKVGQDLLSIKDDWKVAHISSGCDFVGYQFFGSGYKLRRSIYLSAKEALRGTQNKSLPAYFGWVKVLGNSKIKRKYYDAIKQKSK